MNINFAKIFTIIVLSSAIGLIYNYFNPSGLRLISRDKELNWAADSLLSSKNKLKDTSITSPDSLNKIIGEGKKFQVKDNRQKNISAKSENVDTGFDEPLLINLDQAYKLFQMDLQFLDARDKMEYQEGHIKNALSLPYLEYDRYKSILSKIPKMQTIVCYCGGSDCDLSKALANRLFSLGYHNIYVFSGGWGQWKNAGYPVE